jgi:hypothetical protein
MDRRDASPGSSGFQFWVRLLAIVSGCAISVILSEPYLPARVMTKWTADRATSFMTRDQWIQWSLFFVTVPSLLVGAGVRATARRWPRLIHPRLAAMSPPERARVQPVLDALPFAMAGAIAAWFTAFHFIIVWANATSPPRRETWPVLLWTLALLVGVGACVWILHRRLHRASGSGGP